MRIDLATEHGINAAISADVEEAPGLSNVVEYYGRGFLLPFPQTGPENPMANSVESCGEPKATPALAIDSEGFQNPTPWEEPASGGGEITVLTSPRKDAAQGSKNERNAERDNKTSHAQHGDDHGGRISNNLNRLIIQADVAEYFGSAPS